MFHHDIRNKKALNYMWSVNDGTVYLIGYVPIEAIQQEGRTVNQNIFIVVAVMLIAFFLCCIFILFQPERADQDQKRAGGRTGNLQQAAGGGASGSAGREQFQDNVSLEHVT